MIPENKRYKVVCCMPALYMAGGVERVLTLKANYFAEYLGNDITIILTEGTDKPLFYSLSDKIKVINQNIGFEELWNCSFMWNCSFIKKIGMQYEVTIGIPVYRAADYIRQTIESALCQSFPSIEFLIVDDCGEDGSIAIVEEIQQKHPRGKDIRIVCHKRNLGVGVARNQILREARGRYLFFLDSDDIIEPDTISKLISVIYKYDAEIVYGSWKCVDKVTFSPSKYYVYPYQKLMATDLMALFAFSNYSSFRISVCNCLMDLSFLREEKLQFIDSAFWEDLAYTYEMVTRVKRAILLPDITYHYICRPGSLSHYQDREILQKEEILNNVQTINYLKKKVPNLSRKPYAPYLCYNLEMNSFYIICYILKNRNRLDYEISSAEMRSIIQHPLGLGSIFKFRNKFFQNIFFWLISQMPSSLSISIISQLGKIKGVI